ncbi:MAG: hypothetical protein CH6_0695 [Candidatus Kapaibacterium sp.]|nr:MAG: hypothetical protein CH6_0695 [Candidatus Kapabacteria bacterium]
MKNIGLFFALLLVLYSCCSPRGGESLPLLTPNFRGYVGSAPEYFLLNCFYEQQILGTKFGNPDSVIVFNNTLTINPGNRVSLCVKDLNTMDADFYVRVPYGDGVRFYFRAPGKDFDLFPKLIFEYTRTGSRLYEDKKLIVAVDSIVLDNARQSRIFIQNEGEVVHVIVGIDTVYQGRTKLPLSEYIYVEPINSKVIIDDVYFYPITQPTYYY